METKLVSIGEILTKGWNLFSKNYQQFIVPILIMLVPNVLYYLAMFYAGTNILLLLGLTALMIFVSIWISIVLVLMTNAMYLGQPADLNKIFEQSFAKIPSYLLVAILTALAVMGGFILLIIPGIIFAVWFSFSSYINLLEDQDNKGIAALKSSKNMVSGRWLDVFVRLVVPALAVYIVVMVVVFVIGIILGLILNTLNDFDKMMIINMISSVVSLILMPLIVFFGIILYNSLKATGQSAATESMQPTPPTPPTPPIQ